MNDMFTDPRPYLPDHRVWRRLLLIILDPEHKERSILLQKRLWTMRSIGTVIQWNPNVIKLVPLLEDDGDWPDKQFFDDMSAEYLKPFAAVISQLLEIAYAEAKG